PPLTRLFYLSLHDALPIYAGANNGTVSAFNVSRDGVLTSIGASPYPDGQTAPCWVEISHDGKYLFAVNTASANLSRYLINADGSDRKSTRLNSSHQIISYA